MTLIHSINPMLLDTKISFDTACLAFGLPFVAPRSSTCGRCATNRYFQVIGSIHDIESYSSIDNPLSLDVQIFLSHWGHLSLIFLWVSGNLFHMGWNGNYELWLLHPIATIPIAHGIWDPNFTSEAGSDYTVVSFSGISNWLYTLGFSSVFHLYNLVIVFQLLAVISILLGKLHLMYHEELLHWLSFNKPTNGTGALLYHKKIGFDGKVYPLLQAQAAIHLAVSYALPASSASILIGFLSIAWSGHFVHYASLLPINYSNQENTPRLPSLTFLGGLKSDTASLYLTDIAHHHLAIGVLFVWLGHLYLSVSKGFGSRIRDIFVNTYIFRELSTSLQLQISLGLIGLSLITSLYAAHQVYGLTPYMYLSFDYVTTLALYVHHSSIASLLMMGAFAHAGIFLGRDYRVFLARQCLIGRICLQKPAISSHLSWVCLWLGFHTLGVYIHNDTVSAFCEPEKQILIEPVFLPALIPTFFDKGFMTVCFSIACLMPLGPGDLLAHHSIALGLHVTTLILLKGSLDGLQSNLMPDKIHFGYAFACDGPGKGGTCDISAWDSFYLATFWMLNTDAWIGFYFHWKHLALWSQPTSRWPNIGAGVFDESSTYLNGWFRDYLWFNSASLIRGYDPFGANDLSVWAWLFLAAHLCWATGFMFLISWRGYWQELIDIILSQHLIWSFHAEFILVVKC
jgi:photosystem I P700 chlorophyll a apoprotein A2